MGVRSVSGVQADVSVSRLRNGASDRGVLKPERVGEGAEGSWTQAMGNFAHLDSPVLVAGLDQVG